MWLQGTVSKGKETTQEQTHTKMAPGSESVHLQALCERERRKALNQVASAHPLSIKSVQAASQKPFVSILKSKGRNTRGERYNNYPHAPQYADPHTGISPPYATSHEVQQDKDGWRLYSIKRPDTTRYLPTPQQPETVQERKIRARMNRLTSHRKAFPLNGNWPAKRSCHDTFPLYSFQPKYYEFTKSYCRTGDTPFRRFYGIQSKPTAPSTQLKPKSARQYYARGSCGINGHRG